MTGHKDVIRDQDPLWRNLARVELDAEDGLRTMEERKKNPLRHIDHIGLGCRDAETTRHFYEDILGLPLVMVVVSADPYRDDGQQYCHFFFEVGSGTYLAFLDYPAMFTEDDFRPSSAFMRHIAIEVGEDALVQSFRQRLEDAGVATRYTDHGVYHSLYFADPNGHQLEIAFKPESNAEFAGKSRKVAHEIFRGWTEKRPGYARLPRGSA